ncbi:MAG: prepilin-type N-terminal cleavage/methylation domain-containing protein [Gaiellales bacterium]
MTARVLSRLRGQGGYSLIELVAVMAIFLMIVGGLTTLFTSGARAEVDMNRRFEAQQHARMAMDKLRRELHCSSGITATDGSALPTSPVTAIRVTLPSHCPTAGGATTNIVYDTAQVTSVRFQVRRAGVVIADYMTNDDVFTYTAESAASRALLHVDLPVNRNSNEGWRTWRLVDDIVLRNTLRE